MVKSAATRLGSFGRFVTALVATIALGTSLVFAQTSMATILGTVRDTSGALVPGVSITVKHIESGLTRTVVSSERGGYNPARVANPSGRDHGDFDRIDNLRRQRQRSDLACYVFCQKHAPMTAGFKPLRNDRITTLGFQPLCFLNRMNVPGRD